MNRGLTAVYVLIAALLFTVGLAMDGTWASSLSGRESAALIILFIGFGVSGAALRGIVPGE